MIRNILTISTTKMKCEQMFNNIEMLYDYRNLLNLKTFFVYIMIQFHDQNANVQTKLNANFFAKDDLSSQNMKNKNEKMSERIEKRLR